MASSENLASIVDPWAFRTTAFQDPWISDAFSRETETLTRALHKSLAGPNSDAFLSDSMAPFLDLIKAESAPTPTVSGLSGGSEPETAPKRQRNAIPAAGGKVSKRKPRAKKNHTTFITADPANFRQMVQQVTGVRFGNSQVQMAPILKPEPQRLGGRLTVGGGLPTLDTSAFLLNHHQQQVVGQNSAAVTGSEITGPGPLSFGPGMGIANGGPIGSDFDTFSTFPTLESWKVM